jgi:hypothetical protein
MCHRLPSFLFLSPLRVVAVAVGRAVVRRTDGRPPGRGQREAGGGGGNQAGSGEPCSGELIRAEQAVDAQRHPLLPTLIVVLGQAPRCLSRTAPSNGTGRSVAISTGSPSFGEAKQRYFPGHHPSHGPLVGTGFVP